MKDRFINLLQTDKFNFLVIFVVCFLIVLPIFIYGVPVGYDMPHHYQCALTYLEALKSGDFYPSWTLNRNLGYGALELRMYPPVSHYILALFYLLTNNWHLATSFVYLFLWILGSSGIYLLAREFVKPPAALFAAVLFAVMPYRLSQLYLTFLYAELTAIAVLPFCFLFLTRILKEADESDNSIVSTFFSSNVLGLAISYAALILTHLPMTIIGSVSLGIYFFTQARWNFKFLQPAALKSAYGLFLGLCASSFFWVKVIQERFLVAKTAVYDDITVHYRLNFLFTFIQSYDEISIEVYKTITEIYDVILFLTLFIILPIALLGIFSEKASRNRQWRGVYLTLVIAIFFTAVFSRPVWDNIPLLSEVQFPWRFLGIVSIFASVAASAGFANLIRWFANGKRRPFALLILGTIFIGSFFAVNQSMRGAIYKNSAELENYVKTVGRSEGFIFWWTIWARKEFTQNSIDKLSAGSRQINITEWKPTERVFKVEAGEPATIYIATFYHPDWNATINSVPTEILPSSDGGMIISIPPQASSVNLLFKETSLTRYSQLVSVCAWFLLFAQVIIFVKNNFVKQF